MRKIFLYQVSVKDTIQNKAVQNAVVLMLTPVDSVLYKFARTDANGQLLI